jgi:hypothetical protein
MSAENSTADPLQIKPAVGADNRTGNRSRPANPYPQFPLTAVPTGRWCKKNRGRIPYFGPWDDPDAAPAKNLDQKDASHAGRTPWPMKPATSRPLT